MGHFLINHISGQVTFVSKPYIPLAPKAPINPVPLRKIIVDNPVFYNKF